jgi:1,4-dihydroxy-2-naphthoate polyprenyltransferase
MERFITLSRQHPDFLKYLDGTFSESYVALPKRSMNVATSREEVTFEIVPTSEVKGPSFLTVLLTMARPYSAALSIGPAIVAILFANTVYILESRLVVICLLAIASFHIGMNFLDDYFDHRRGVDRLNPRSGSQAIQNGWVRARTMYRAGLGLLGFAVLLGLPVILQRPVLLLTAAVFALLIAWGFSSQTARLKYRGLGEITTFLLSGPLLTAGLVWALVGELRWQAMILGCAFGFTTVIYYHLKNLENIMVDSQAEARTLATRLGFDKSKKMVWVLAALSSLSILIFDWAVNADGYFILVFVAHAAALFPITKRLRNAPSPLSSNLSEIRKAGLRAHLITTIAFSVAIFLYPYLFGTTQS